MAEELIRSAPALVSLLTSFNRLVSGEDMPPRRPLRRLRRKLSRTALSWVFVSVWTFLTAGMIAFALILSHAGQGSVAGGTGSCQPSASFVPCSQVKAPAVPGK